MQQCGSLGASRSKCIISTWVIYCKAYKENTEISLLQLLRTLRLCGLFFTVKSAKQIQPPNKKTWPGPKIFGFEEVKELRVITPRNGGSGGRLPLKKAEHQKGRNNCL